MSSKNARELRKVKRDFLLSFFSDSGEYAELEVNGFWLVKQWKGEERIGIEWLGLERIGKVFISKLLKLLKPLTFILKCAIFIVWIILLKKIKLCGLYC